MGFLKTIYNQLMYKRMMHRLNKLPEAQRRKLGQKMYEEGYNAMKLLRKGEVFGACSVIFECPYEGHVSYYISSELDRRVADEDDPMRYGNVRRMDDGSWIVTVVVSSDTGSHAMVTADSCAMSAILRAKTATGAFYRAASVIETADGVLPPEKETIEALESNVIMALAAVQ